MQDSEQDFGFPSIEGQQSWTARKNGDNRGVGVSSRIVVYSKSASATWLSVAVGVAGVGGSRGRSIFVLVVWRCLAAAGTIGDVWVRVGVHPWCILNLNGFLVA